MRKIYDPMEFQPGMQQINSDIFDRVIAARKAYQPEQYTARQVKAALQKEELSFEDFAALLSPAAQPFLEQMARRAKTEQESTSATMCCYLRRCIFPTTARTSAFTAVSTAKMPSLAAS